ncbi:hypothetical protein [Paracoccus sp. TOH]|uniref:Uncharacterized protein n=1 Tax=Paracoccus simplex TaxID=2086346 RepID=A0ABV7S3E4_9RHOB|nr:hypothetical protein [Paracoccus sp. TOH]WJS85150.1 hypothetical protein NBE95_05085 [Paracoccus sp. TOH]
MVLVRYAFGMLGITLCVLSTTRMQADCRAGCAAFAAARWDPGEVLPGLAGLLGGFAALAFPQAGKAQPPPGSAAPVRPGPPPAGG